MPRGRILLIDDDEKTRRTLAGSLADRGYEMLVVSTGEDGLAKTFIEKPDLIILDADLTGIDAPQFCHEIRGHCLAPILLLSERCDETSVVVGLGAGADGCFVKPIKLASFLAHVDAAVRRETIYAQRRSRVDLLTVKDLTIDLSAFEVRRNGRVIPLTTTEFKLMYALAQNAGRVITRGQLLDRVWEARSDGIYSRTVDVHVGRIRRKLGDDPSRPRYIVTIPGLGYKMPNKD